MTPDDIRKVLAVRFVERVRIDRSQRSVTVECVRHRATDVEANFQFQENRAKVEAEGWTVKVN